MSNTTILPVYKPRGVRHIGAAHSCMYEVRDILVPLLCFLCVRGSVTERYNLQVCNSIGGESLCLSSFLSTRLVGTIRATVQLASSTAV